MQHRVPYAVIVAVWLLSMLLWLTPGITRPDGAGYFVYLPSTLLDRDLLFFNEWERIGLVRDGQLVFKEVTETRHMSNHWTAGTSLAWYPAYLAGHALAALNGDTAFGFSVFHVAAVAVTSALAGLFVLLAGTRLSMRWFTTPAAVIGAIAVWFGSPLAWYSLRHATMSHAISAAACAAVVLLSLRLRDERSASLLLATGLAIGFACAVRPQNIVIAVVPLLIAPVVPLLRRAHVVAAGAILAALPQLVVSQTLWGGPLVFANIGGRAHSWQMFARFRPLETIFSWYHGLATWSPLLIVALIGFVWLWRVDRGLGRAAVVTFLLQWLLLSALERWFWGGASFGQRRFDSCTIFFILGVAAFIDRLPRWTALILVALTTGWSMLLFIAASHLNLNRYQSPAELVSAIAAALPEPTWRAYLGYTPPEMRVHTSLTMVIVTTLTVAVVFLAMRHRRLLPSAAALYFAAASAFYAWCGLNPKYDEGSRSLIARHDRGEMISADRRDAITLLLHEADYMERTGRPAEAEAARQEAADLSR
jgi:hypothetical protein